MVATGLDTAERRLVGFNPIHSCFEKRFPVVLRDVVKRFGETLQCIWLHLRWTAGRSKKDTAEVVEGFVTVRLFANRRIDFEPDEQPLVVEIHSAPHRFPIAARVVEPL